MPETRADSKLSSRPLTVAARPAYYNRSQDPGNYFLYTEIAGTGTNVVEGTIRNIFLKRYDILHVHWPDNVLRSKSLFSTLVKVGSLFSLLAFARLFGRSVVWTAHNSVSHEKHHPRLEKCFWRIFGRMTNGIIVHSNAEYDRLRDTPDFAHIDHWAIIPLPAFTGMYALPPDSRLLPAPGKLPRITYAGRLRRYKGAEELIECFKTLHPGQATLTVAGKPEDRALANEMTASVAGRADIALRLGFLTPEDLCQLLIESDLVVLPFKWVTNSGSTLLALTYGAKVLVPDTPYFREMQAEFGSDWVRLFQYPLTRAALTDAITWSGEREGRRLPEIPESRTLKFAADRHVRFYHTLES